MAVDWTGLLEAARAGDESARAGAIIRAQAELERHLGASGWSRQEGESLHQLLIRARQQSDAPWISEDIGWAIQLRNRIAHEGLQPEPRDALRAIEAYQDAALKLGWTPPAAAAPAAAAAPPSTPAGRRRKVLPPEPGAEGTTPVGEAPSAPEGERAPRTRRTSSRKGKGGGAERGGAAAPSSGGFLAALVVLGGVVLGVGGLARWSQGPRAPTGLRSWVLPVQVTASSEAEGKEAPRAADGDPRTAWCEGTAGVGVGERLTLYLPEASWVEGVRLKGGMQADAAHLARSRSPTRVTLIAGPHAVGAGLEATLGRFAEVELPEAVRVTSLTLVVEAVASGSGSETCLSEVEVRVRR